jgi:hypothetical protein
MSEILYNYSFSLNFPKAPNPEIARDSLISVVKQQLEVNNIVFIYGEEEIGKTNTLSQFARTYYSHSFSCFLKPLNKYSSLVENVLIDLICQFHYYITKEEIDANDLNPDLKQFSSYINKLTRLSKGRTSYYVILDGFENIDTKDVLAFQELFQQLPLGLSFFKFLISDKDQFVYENFLKDHLKGKVKLNEMPIFPFGMAEVGTYCSELNLKSEQIAEILKITGGIPGRVKSIYEKLMEGKSYDEIFSNLSYADFIIQQINKLNFNDTNLLNLLAFVSLEDVEYSLNVIAKILTLNKNLLRNYLDDLDFLEITENETVRFKSSYFKRTLKSKMLSKQNFIDEAIISYYIKSASDIDSIMELPKRYEKAKKFEELLALLDETYFLTIIEQKQSYNYLEDQTTIGINAAKILNKTTDFFRLTLQKATISELKQTYVWEEEIEAKIELKALEEARKLAESALLKEERFRLLLFLAKIKKQKKLLIEADLVESIKLLYNQITPQTFYDSEEILNIANNLAYTLPELALEFLEKAYVGERFENKDWSFAQLSILLHSLNQSDEEKDSKGTLSSKISDPKIRSLTNALSFYNDKGGVKEFLNEMEMVESVSDKMFLIRKYIEENSDIENIQNVMDYAINLLVTQPEGVSITGTTMYDISIPMPSLRGENISELFHKLESFKGITKEKGPTVSHYKFLINLSICALNIDVADGKLKAAELYQDVSKITDIQLKTEIAAYYYKVIKNFDKKQILNQEYDILEILMLEIETGVEKLLSSTANQCKIIENINKELVCIEPAKVIQYCSKLNIFFRREDACLDALIGYLDNKLELMDFSIIQNFHNCLLDTKNKNTATYEVLKRFKRYNGDILNDFPIIKDYLFLIKDFYKEELKLKAYCVAFAIVDKCVNNREELIQIFFEEVFSFIKDASNVFHKVQFGFKIASILVKIDKSKAILFHDYSVGEKQMLFFKSPIAMSTYFNSIRLAVMSLIGLINSNNIEKSVIEKFIDYIKVIPIKTDEVSLICDLLINVYRAKEITLFEQLYTAHVKEYVSLLLTKNNNFSEDDRVELIKIISPVVYLHNKDTSFLLIDKIDSLYRDDCYFEIFGVLVKKGERANNNTEKENSTIDFETANSVLNLLDRINNDNTICNILDHLRLCAKNNSFVKSSIITLKEKIERIIDEKLPDSINIQHDGYKILCTAYLYKIEKNVKDRSWLELIEKTRNIPNISDKAFVLIQLAYLLPDLRSISKAQLISETLISIESICSYVARVERYSDIKYFLKEVNITECKEGLKKAIFDSVKENSLELYSVQKSIVDFAYEIDSGFADELIKIIDADPARERIAFKLKQHTKLLKAKDDFIEDKFDREIREVEVFSNACIEYIKKLRYNRVRYKEMKDACLWLNESYKRPISETYPIFVLFLENANKRFENTGINAKIQLTPYYEATLRNLQMVKVLAGKNGNESSDQINNNTQSLGSRIIVGIGEKDRAVNYIKEWAIRESADYIKICDPYFSVEELSFVKELYFAKPELSYLILTKYTDANKNWIKSYSEKWISICDQDPPDIRIVMVGLKNDYNYFIGAAHDRWITTHEAGLRLGGSLNTYGKQASEISQMSSIDAIDTEKSIIDPFLNREKKFHNENKITYFEFNI